MSDELDRKTEQYNVLLDSLKAKLRTYRATDGAGRGLLF